VHRIAGWWDGFELWVAGLPFIPQFLVVLVGMVPVSFAIAYVLDLVLRAALQLLGRDRAEALPEEPAVSILVPDTIASVVVARESVQSGAR
jgi:uncharacterized membrane protein